LSTWKKVPAELADWLTRAHAFAHALPPMQAKAAMTAAATRTRPT
jgi:hypothetical protein